MSELPLAGVVVVDAAEWPGEQCGRILADLGATVVRVEPEGGAPSRHAAPIASRASSFAWRNANKLGVTRSVDELAGRADVIIVSDQKAANDLAARHTDAVVTAVTPFGLTGPHAAWVATDATVVAAGGMLYRAGTPERPPVTAPGALAAEAAGVSAALATLTALYRGGGALLDVSAVEAVAQLADWALPGWSQSQQTGHRQGAGMIYPLYECADGHVRMVSPLSLREWHALRDWLGQPEELSGTEWEDTYHRILNGEPIKAAVATLFAARSKNELSAEGMARGLAVTPVLRPGEVMDNPHSAARGMFRDAEVAPGERGRVMAGCFVVDGERAGFRHRAPQVGEHDAEIDALMPARTPTARHAGPAPLAGLRVLDFGVGGVGPEAARMLAEMGADVVKVEGSSHIDFMRGVLGGTINAQFASSNRSKRSLGIDLRSSGGRDVVMRMVAQADVVIENSGAGVMDRLGLGADVLLAANSELCVISSQLMGAEGPWSAWKGYGPNVRTVGGLTWLWCHADEVDNTPGTTTIHPDHFVGRVQAIAALAMVLRRRRTGAGGHAEVPQVDAVMASLGDLLLDEARAPGSVVPIGNTAPWAAPWDVYQCAGEDEWCVINVRDDNDWVNLRTALDDPAWASDEALATTAGRLARRVELDEALATWTMARSPMEVAATLQAHCVPAAMAAHPASQAEDGHMQARRFQRPVDQPAIGALLMEGPAFTADGFEPDVRPAPLLAADTRRVCHDWLQLDDAEIDELVAAGVLEEAASG